MIKRKFHLSGKVLLVLLLVILKVSFLFGQIVRNTARLASFADSLMQSNKVELPFGQETRNRSLQSISTVQRLNSGTGKITPIYRHLI